MKKKVVFKYKALNNDFIRVSLINPPLEGVDDILLEVKSENINLAQGYQDWEALIVMQGFQKVLAKKYGSFEKCIKELHKNGSIKFLDKKIIVVSDGK